MVWKDGDIVDIKPNSETHDKLDYHDGDPKGQIELTLKDKGVVYDKNEPLPDDALWGWEVLVYSDSYMEIRKTLSIKGHTIEIQMSPVKDRDIVKTRKAQRELAAELVKKRDIPTSLTRNIVRFVGGKRRTWKTRKGRKSAKKTIKGRR